MSELKKDKVNFAEEFHKGLAETKISFTCKTRADEMIFGISMELKHAPAVNVHVIVDEGGDCKLRCNLVDSVPEERRVNMLRMINEMHLKYRYLCITLDRDGDVWAGYDFQVHSDADTVFVQIMGMVLLFTKVLEKCVPDIMLTLWLKE